MANSKVTHIITPTPLQEDSDHALLWTNPAYGLSPEVDLVSSWEEAKAYVSLIY